MFGTYESLRQVMLKVEMRSSRIYVGRYAEFSSTTTSVLAEQLAAMSLRVVKSESQQRSTQRADSWGSEK